MGFFIWRKNKVLFCRYLVLVFSDICTPQNLWAHHRHDFFFWTLGSMKLKFGQMLMQLTKDNSNLFWAQFWKRKLVPGPFMILINYQYVVVDINCFSPLIPHHQNSKRPKNYHLVIEKMLFKLLNWKWPETRRESSHTFKTLSKKIAP